ncbi:MAG: CoA ester lyase [Firmicutes bacterium]|nr:CoA ester lyase [Bacillota bacterium]
METARGVSRVDEITLSSPRVRRIAFGAGDFTVDLGIDLTSDGVEIHYARSRIAVASRSAGIDGPIDTVYMEVTNVQGLEADTRRAKQIGFQGKLVIHPDRIPQLHRVFSPTLDEVQEAREIIQAYEEAVSRGVGAIKVRGKLVDYPIVNRARRVMELGNPRLG